MFKSIEEIRQERLRVLNPLKDSTFAEGVLLLLTEIYPDNAHFIYELLQNAEDMDATEVRFFLDKKGIDFEHNGTKRTFNLDDIDAITSIGNNTQKINDVTSIGKFGVGFKAVFSYTSTPYIHSGDYHFKIVDNFVPEYHGVEKISTCEDGVEWTKFSFPFNKGAEKPAEVAYKECLEGLKKLDSSVLLFLRHIKKINYLLPSGEHGYIERRTNENHRILTKCKMPETDKVDIFNWLRFERMVDIIDQNKRYRTLPISVAFYLDIDEKTGKECIAPIKNGRTFIYFPLEKEYSGLRFHINAPFASTVARDSVIHNGTGYDGKNISVTKNEDLIKSISQLICDSLEEIKSQGLMNHSFFEVLPHERDNLSEFYSPIREDIFNIFHEKDYLPTVKGDYTSAKKAIVGDRSISSVLSSEDMYKLLNVRKIWVDGPEIKNSNADFFFESLKIQKYDFREFSQTFDSPSRQKIEQIVRESDNEWLKHFYLLCAKTYDCLDFNTRTLFVSNLGKSAVIRSSNGMMYKSSEIFILPVNTKLLSETTPVVDPSFVFSLEKKDETTEIILSFFQEILKIREYGPKVEVKERLRIYDEIENMRGYDSKRILGSLIKSGQHLKDLILFAKYSEENNDVDFSRKSIFLFRYNGNNSISCTKAYVLFLGSVYGNDDGQILADILKRPCLWEGYTKYYNEQDLQKFIEFVSSCGVNKTLEIVKKKAEDNPLFNFKLNSSDKITKNHESSDYKIPNLGELLNNINIDISRMIWKTLERYGKRGGRRYITARYAPNSSVVVKTCDSSFIQQLKEAAWLPDKQGKFFKPHEISFKRLHDDFAYNPDNEILEALEIGSGIEKEIQQKKKLEAEAQKFDLYLVNAKQKEMLNQLEAQLAKKRDVEKLPSEELLNKQKRNSIASLDYGDDFSSDGRVNNLTRRENNIEATFRNAEQMKPKERKIFSRVSESNKKEKDTLYNWYHGTCQMCGITIIKYNQKPHFVAKNIINTQDLSASIRQTELLAWNSLCLCPNCAAKYTYCSRDLNGLLEQISENEVIEGDSEEIVLTIELGENKQDIRYVPAHFLHLKKAIELIDEEFESKATDESVNDH
jgi:hypothetical protein